MKRLFAMFVCVVYAATAIAFNFDIVKAEELQELSDSIVIDGNIDEWRTMAAQSVEDGSVDSWKIAKSEDGSMLYICYNGIAVTEWDSTYIYDLIEIEYGNGTSFKSQVVSIADSWVVPGAKVAYVNTANGNNKGNYSVECALPIVEQDYYITFAGKKVSAFEIPVFEKAPEIIPSYEGIVIDGTYDDWAAVSTTDAICPSDGHEYDCLSKAAVVFDGDYVYIYLKDGENGSAAGAGVASNGRYSITTDTGRQLVFQVSASNGGTVNGVAGATAKYFGSEWEIAIPASELPLWNKSISFGLYMDEPFVKDVMNLQDISGDAGEFDSIVYDGLYGDWNAYPHTLIQYATPGTGTDAPDGEGALYSDGSILYGHVVSTMQAHLEEAGGEFASAVSICFNGKKDYNGDKTWNFYPRLVAVAADGTIDWNPKTKDLEKGEYEFYLADARGEYNTNTITNVSQLAKHEQFFGKMHITVGDVVDEMEFYVDLEQVAKFLSYYSGDDIEANDFQLIEAQFGRIGTEWLSIAGASSGPFGAVAAGTIGASVLAFLLKRRRYKVVG